MQAPGVLLNGAVRVSIVDLSGFVGAIRLSEENKPAINRLQPWAGKEGQIDRNGRLDMYCHVDPTPLLKTEAATGAVSQGCEPRV